MSEHKIGSNWLRWALSIAILAGLGLAVYKYVNGEEVLTALRAFNLAWVAPILLLSATYLWLKALWFGIALKPLAGVPMGAVMRAYMAGQPATLMPGGIAARVGLMAQAGVRGATSSAPVLLNSVLDQLSFIILALVSALWFEAARMPALIALGVIALIALLLLIPWTRRGLASAMRWVLGRFKAEQHWDHFVESLSKVSTFPILGSGVAITLLAKFLLVVILDLCLRGVGISAGYPALLLATTLPTMLGRMTPLPAGVGPTEVGMVAVLAQAAGIDVNQATAATAIFRVTTVLFHALLGAVVYFLFWHPEREAGAQASESAVEQPEPRRTSRRGRSPA